MTDLQTVREALEHTAAPSVGQALLSERIAQLEASVAQKILMIKLLREALSTLPGGTAALGRAVISNPAYAPILEMALKGSHD